MPLLRQNLGDQHWMCIPTTIFAMLVVLMRPAHRQRSVRLGSVILSVLLQQPQLRTTSQLPRRIGPPRRIRPSRRIRLPRRIWLPDTCPEPRARHMSGPTTNTGHVSGPTAEWLQSGCEPQKGAPEVRRTLHTRRGVATSRFQRQCATRLQTRGGCPGFWRRGERLTSAILSRACGPVSHV